MKTFRLLIVLLVAAAANHAYGQDSSLLNAEDSTASLDILRAPVSPAANMLGISNSQVDKPSDPAAFMVSLHNATDNFSTLPSSYAVDIAPFWLFGGKNIKIEDYLKTDSGLSSLGRNLKQSLTVSVATQTVPDTPAQGENLTRFAFGLKVALFRGNSIDESYLNKINGLKSALKTLTSDLTGAVDTLLLGDSHYQSLKALRDSIMRNSSLTFSQRTSMTQPIRDQLAAIESNTLKTVQGEKQGEFNALKGIMEDAQLTRYGFKLDLSGGLAVDYPNQNYDNGEVTKAGVWATTGWDWKDGTSVLAIARWLMHPDLTFTDATGGMSTANVTTFDAGARLIHNVATSNFEISAEGLYRSTSRSDIDPGWRVTVNAAYDIGKNKKLTFIYGKDFDGTVTKNGNVITALNLLVGFGTNKRLL